MISNFRHHEYSTGPTTYRTVPRKHGAQQKCLWWVNGMRRGNCDVCIFSLLLSSFMDNRIIANATNRVISSYHKE